MSRFIASDWEKSLYTVRLTPDGIYRIVKLDGWFNVLSINHLWPNGLKYRCSCQRGMYPECRHRRIRLIAIRDDKVDSGWLWDYDTEKWERPINDPIREFMRKGLAAKEQSTLTELLRKSVG